jgi:hypothetical protein
VCSRNLENEEAKARYRAVENTTTMGCNARKTNKQTTAKQQLLLCAFVGVLINMKKFDFYILIFR